MVQSTSVFPQSDSSNPFHGDPIPGFMDDGVVHRLAVYLYEPKVPITAVGRLIEVEHTQDQSSYVQLS